MNNFEQPEAPKEYKSIEEADNEVVDPVQEKWNTFYVEYKKVWREVMKKIFGFDEEKKKKFLEMVRGKEQESFRSVEDPGKYLTYHLSIGGSTGIEHSPKLDFEGDASLMKFHKELLEKMEHEDRK